VNEPWVLDKKGAVIGGLAALQHARRVHDDVSATAVIIPAKREIRQVVSLNASRDVHVRHADVG
jgi:hypothetical protein